MMFTWLLQYEILESNAVAPYSGRLGYGTNADAPAPVGVAAKKLETTRGVPEIVEICGNETILVSRCSSGREHSTRFAAAPLRGILSPLRRRSIAWASPGPPTLSSRRSLYRTCFYTSTTRALEKIFSQSISIVEHWLRVLKHHWAADCTRAIWRYLGVSGYISAIEI